MFEFHFTYLHSFYCSLMHRSITLNNHCLPKLLLFKLLTLVPFDLFSANTLHSSMDANVSGIPCESPCISDGKHIILFNQVFWTKTSCFQMTGVLLGPEHNTILPTIWSHKSCRRQRFPFSSLFVQPLFRFRNFECVCLCFLSAPL